MNRTELFKAFGDIDENLIEKAGKDMNKMNNNTTKANNKKIINIRRWGAIAACLCIMGIGALTISNVTGGNSNVPNPAPVQVMNPLITVDSAEAMEGYLDYIVPVLNKDVENYIVIVYDGFPRAGRIVYADGSTFNMKYGNGDVSGIYGGTKYDSKKIGKVTVTFNTYVDYTGSSINYAVWEQNGFSYSLEGNENLEAEVGEIIGLMK